MIVRHSCPTADRPPSATSARGVLVDPFDAGGVDLGGFASASRKIHFSGLAEQLSIHLQHTRIECVES